MAAPVLLGLCSILGLHCNVTGEVGVEGRVQGQGLELSLGLTLPPGGRLASLVTNVCSAAGYTSPQGAPIPPLLDGSISSVLSLSVPLPFGPFVGEEEGWEWRGEGSAENVVTNYPLPFPVFEEGKEDVGTGTALVWSYRNGGCRADPSDSYASSPQYLSLGWWQMNPRHPERGSTILLCDMDRGRNVVSTGATRAISSNGGVVIHCPGSAPQAPRSYSSRCTLFRFTNDACVSATIATGRAFSYVFRCQGTGN